MINKDVASVVRYITQGVYVIAVRDNERKNAFTAAWVMQVSFQPLMLCFSINPEHHSYQLLQATNICTVNALSKQQMQLAEHFARSGGDKMTGFEWQTAPTGAPILSEAIAYFDCRINHYADAGDHKLVICSVVDAGVLNTGEPLLYNDTGNMDGSQELYQRGTK